MQLPICLFLIAFIGCSQDDYPGPDYLGEDNALEGRRVYILNEGNYGYGTGSLSVYYPDSNKVIQGVFQKKNNRPLGDIPCKMMINDSIGYIIVNNSGTIEALNLSDFKSLGTLGNMYAPRSFVKLNNQEILVSDLYHSLLYEVNLDNLLVSGTIPLTKTAEDMLIYDDKLILANWSQIGHPEKENNTIQFIDKTDYSLIAELELTKEPNSMVLDKFNRLWVLCSGGFNHEEPPALYIIDPEDIKIKKSFVFENDLDDPAGLSINYNKDTLFFINQHIYSLSVLDNSLPNSPLIEKENHNFYTLGIDPLNSDIYVSDALDYNQNGLVLRFSSKGIIIDTFTSGIIPGKVVFN